MINRLSFHLIIIVIAVLYFFCCGRDEIISGDGGSPSSDANDGSDEDIIRGGLLTWAISAGGPDRELESLGDFGRDISVLDDETFFVTGSYSREATFGKSEQDETTLTSYGIQHPKNEIYIARYNVDNTLAWAATARSSHMASNVGVGIEALLDSSCLVTGHFSGTATFGAGEISEISLETGSILSMFVAKYNEYGRLAWAIQAGGDGIARVYGISALSNGSFSLTGEFKNDVVFGMGESKETILRSKGEYDMFLAHYNSDGTLLWARSAGGDGYTHGSDIVILSDSHCLVLGWFIGNAVFGSGDPTETVFESPDGSSMFIAMYNQDGILVWVRRAIGTVALVKNGISALADGSFFVTGTFEGEATFGPDEDEKTELTSSGEMDMFVARYNYDGTLSWVRTAGGMGRTYGKDVSGISEGSCVTIGQFCDTVTFGRGEPSETTFRTSDGDEPYQSHCSAYVAHYNDDGKFSWARYIDTTEGWTLSEGISSLRDGSSLVIGEFWGTITFGPGEINETTLSSNIEYDRGYDIFVMRLDP